MCSGNIKFEYIELHGVLALGGCVGHETKQKEDTTCNVLGLQCKHVVGWYQEIHYVPRIVV